MDTHLQLRGASSNAGFVGERIDVDVSAHVVQGGVFDELNIARGTGGAVGR